jgi:hypothetical protein
MPKPLAASTLERAVEQIKETPEALEKFELHEKDACVSEIEAAEVLAEETEADLARAIGGLHRQAHPGESRMVIGCRLEPCRSIPITAYPEVALA